MYSKMPGLGGDFILSICKNETVRGNIPPELFSVLPEKVLSAVGSLGGRLEEIRLRSPFACSAIVGGENVRLPVSLSQSELNEIVNGFCGGSLYAFTECINNGFIPFASGIRVGIVGRASVEAGKIIGVYGVSALSVRIPSVRLGIGAKIADTIRGEALGVLIYSAPGVGKTTLLRGIISELSDGEAPLRVAVIDTRNELFVPNPRGFTDILSGYPRKDGIEIATRTMNPQVIICDEIGDYEEAFELIGACNCGVPVVATAHAGSVSELMHRSGIAVLHSAGIFSRYVGISRNGSGGFNYDVTRREDVDNVG